MAMGRFAAACLLSGVGLAAACSLGGAPEGVVDRCAWEEELPPGVSTDILFVIDHSGSMSEEQEKVARQLERFVATLAEGPVDHDFRVGVITTGVSLHSGGCSEDDPAELQRYPEESGRLQPATLPGEEQPGPLWLSHDDPDLIERFAALVRQGTRGSGQEMGLEAMRLALTEPLLSEQGFVRPGARLLVVIVSDEDDCSDPTGTSLVVRPTCDSRRCSDDDDCPGEGHYCLTGRWGRSCVRSTCETPEGREALEPVETYVDLLLGMDDGTGRGRKRETWLAVIGAVDPESGEPARCTSSVDEAEGVAIRYRRAVELMGDRGTVASICADDYGPALEHIAEMVAASHVLELPQAPADERLLRLEIRRANGETTVCTAADGFTYEPPANGFPARIVLDERCRLRHGDRLSFRLLCAG